MWIKVARGALLCDERLECSKDNDFKLLNYLKATLSHFTVNVGFRKKLFTKFTLQMGSNATLKW